MGVEKKAYSPKEFAVAYGLGIAKVYQLCNSEGFPAIRVGTRILIPVDRAEAWINKQSA